LLASECNRSVADAFKDSVAAAFKDGVAELRKDEKARMSLYVHAKLYRSDGY